MPSDIPELPIVRSLLRNARDAIFLCAWFSMDGKPGVFLEVSDAMSSILGYSSDELRQMRPSDLFADDGAQESGGELHRELCDYGRACHETVMRTRTGDLIHFQLACHTVTLGDQRAIMGVARDVSERLRAEQELRKEDARLEGLFRITQYRASDTQDLLEHTLEEAIRLTDSEIASIYRYDEGKREFTLNSWSRKVMSDCQVLDRRSVYRLDDLGLWGEAVRQRKPIVVNNFGQSHHVTKGYPEGHIEIRRFLQIPVIFEDRIVAVAAVANKRAEYDAADVRQLALLMDSAWKVVVLHEANDALMARVEELQVRNRESALIAELSDLLLKSASQEDGCAVVSHCLPKLFPGSSGGLYLVDQAGGLLRAAASWGSAPLDECLLAEEECWGLKRNELHAVRDVATDLACRHARGFSGGGYLCVPMNVRGETLGLLHIGLEQAPTESHERLADSVAEHIGLAISNLRLWQMLSDQAARDPLTGLYNRRFMEEMLDREISRASRRGTPISLVMIDLDHFKPINDLYGHEAGDAVLLQVSAFLRRHIRGADIACRFGGDEIAIVFPETDLPRATQRTRELLSEIELLKTEYGDRLIVGVTASAGVSAYPVHGDNPRDLLRSADLALYGAKAAGRDRVLAAPAPH